MAVGKTHPALAVEREPGGGLKFLSMAGTILRIYRVAFPEPYKNLNLLEILQFDLLMLWNQYDVENVLFSLSKFSISKN